MRIHIRDFIWGTPVTYFHGVYIPVCAEDIRSRNQDPFGVYSVRIDREHSTALWQSAKRFSTPQFQEFNNLLRLADMVSERVGWNAIVQTWHFEDEVGEAQLDSRYLLLRDCMSALANRVRESKSLLISFHEWSDSYASKSSNLCFMFIALEDLARAGPDSDAFHMLDYLAALENDHSLRALSNVIRAMPEMPTKRSIGTAKAIRHSQDSMKTLLDTLRGALNVHGYARRGPQEDDTKKSGE